MWSFNFKVDHKVQMIIVAQGRPNYIDDPKPARNDNEAIGVINHYVGKTRRSVEISKCAIFDTKPSAVKFLYL